MHLKDIDLRLLRLFVTVVQSSGFTAAAERLNVGRPTVSTQMADLEARLGMRLCERGRSGFSLTEHGEQVYERAQRLLASIEEFSADMDAIQGHLSGEINLGQIDYMTSVSEFRMSEVIEAFCDRAPAVTINLLVLPQEEVVRGVLDGRLHLGIVGEPATVSGLDMHSFLTESLYLYCGSSHPLFERRDGKITRAELAAARLAGETMAEDPLRKLRVGGRADARANNLEAVLMLIRSGHYIGYLPDHFAQQWVEQGELRVLKPSLTHIRSGLPVITRSRARKSPQLDLFLSILMRAHNL
jgi:LysR family transcriptional regulator, transcriptional activator for bauABCD operon